MLRSLFNYYLLLIAMVALKTVIFFVFLGLAVSLKLDPQNAQSSGENNSGTHDLPSSAKTHDDPKIAP